MNKQPTACHAGRLCSPSVGVGGPETARNLGARQNKYQLSPPWDSATYPLRLWRVGWASPGDVCQCLGTIPCAMPRRGGRALWRFVRRGSATVCADISATCAQAVG